MRWKPLSVFEKAPRFRRKLPHSVMTSMSYVKSSVGFRSRSRRLRVRKRRTLAFTALLFMAALVWLLAHAHRAPRADVALARAPEPVLSRRAVAVAAPWSGGERDRLWS